MKVASLVMSGIVIMALIAAAVTMVLTDHPVWAAVFVFLTLAVQVVGVSSDNRGNDGQV